MPYIHCYVALFSMLIDVYFEDEETFETRIIKNVETNDIGYKTDKNKSMWYYIDSAEYCIHDFLKHHFKISNIRYKGFEPVNAT